MPEGPSIVILREETAKFAGQVVREVSGNSRQDIQRMAGQRVRAICSWGKHFLVVFDGFFLRVHFMLFGRYRVDALKENASPRLSLRFDNGELNLYACSVKFVEGAPDDHYDWRGDVMADAWSAKLARDKLKALPHMLAADALLEQDVFAGVGNIIKNEVLWRIRVHPESTIGALPSRQLGDLIREARAYSFDFLAWKKAFVLRKHYQVHTKSTCPRDGHKITWRKHLGEKRRRAFFCEACQTLYRDAPEAVSPSDHVGAAPPPARRAKRPAQRVPARRLAAKQTAAKPTAAKTPNATKGAAKTPAAKKVAAQKVAAQKVVAKTVAATKRATKKVAPKKAGAKKIAPPPAKKDPAKTPARQAAVGRATSAGRKAAAPRGRLAPKTPARRNAPGATASRDAAR